MPELPQTPRPDEDRVARPDLDGLRVLAHPLRLRLLGLLRSDGPATASQLATRTAQSSGTTSYHLRQLEAGGFVAEATDRGNGRDRWWRATQRSTRWDFDDEPDAEADAVGEQYLRAVAETYARRTDASINALPTLEDDLGPGWRRAFSLSDYQLRLTREEAEQLVADLEALAERYRRNDPEQREAAPDGAARVALHFAVLPQIGSVLASS